MRHYFSSSCRIALGAALCLTAIEGAHAQTAEPDVNLKADEQTRASEDQIGEIVVTAQKRTENAQRVPISITALGQAELQRNGGLRNALDLTKSVPGLQVNALFGLSNPTIYIRGVGVNSYDAASAGAVGITYDEVFLNSGVGALFSAFDIERVEVLKGPQGTLYGRNTTGGVINYTTAQPSFTTKVTASATVGNFGAGYFEFGAGGPIISDTLAVRVSGVYKRRDGYVRNDLSGNDLNNINISAGRLQILWRPTPNLDIENKVEVGKSKSSAIAFTTLGTFNAAAGRACTGAEILQRGICSNPITGYIAPTDIDHIESDVPNTSEVLSSFTERLSLNWTGDNVRFTSISAYVRNLRELNQDQDDSPFGILTSPLWPQKSRQFTQELRLSSVGDGRLKWVLGAYYLQERLNSDADFDVLKVFRPDPTQPFFLPTGPFRIKQSYSQRTVSKAVFAQLDYKLTDSLTLTAGARYTDDVKHLLFRTFVGPIPPIGQESQPLTPANGLAGFVDADQSNFTIDAPANVTTTMRKPTWRLALDYQVTPDVNVYGSYSRGIRSGGYNTSAFFIGEFKPVRPERIDAFEVGIKSDLFDRHVRFNASAFYSNYRDQQVFSLYRDPVSGAFSQLQQNASSHIYGGEFQLQVRPARGLSLGASGTYLHARYTDFVDARGDFRGKHVEKSPTWQFAGNIDYSKSLGGQWTGRVGAVASYQSRVYMSPLNVAPATSGPHAMVDLSAGLNAADLGLDLSLWVKNVVDRRVITDVGDGSAFGYWSAVYNEPRTFGATLKYTY